MLLLVFGACRLSPHVCFECAFGHRDLNARPGSERIGSAHDAPAGTTYDGVTPFENPRRRKPLDLAMQTVEEQRVSFEPSGQAIAPGDSFQPNRRALDPTVNRAAPIHPVKPVVRTLNSAIDNARPRDPLDAMARPFQPTRPTGGGNGQRSIEAVLQHGPVRYDQRGCDRRGAGPMIGHLVAEGSVLLVADG